MTTGKARPLGLGKDRLLRKTDEFSSVFRFKRVLRGSCADVYARPNGLTHARLGLTVSRRVARLAVQRNLYRRLMREIFRLRQMQLAGLDIVVRLKAACPPDPFKDEFARLLDGCRACGQAEQSPPDPNTSTP